MNCLEKLYLSTLVVLSNTVVIATSISAAPVSSDDLFLPPSLIAEDFYPTHVLSYGDTQSYTLADLNADQLLGVRILPLLNPNPSTIQGEYTASHLSAINSANYSTYFFRKPNVDYFADFTPSLISVDYPTTGQFFVEIRAQNNGMEFSRVFHDEVDDSYLRDPPGDTKDAVKRVITSPKADLLVVSEGDPDDNGVLPEIFATLKDERKNVKQANSLAKVKELIEAEFRAKGRKISLVLSGHGRPGSIKIGTERINSLGDGAMTPLDFQKMIDPWVKRIEFWSCETAQGAEGDKFLKDFASSIGSAFGFTVNITAAPPIESILPFLHEKGYFDTNAGAKKVGEIFPVPEPGAIALVACGLAIILFRKPQRR